MSVEIQTSFHREPDSDQYPTTLEVGDILDVTEYESIRIAGVQWSNEDIITAVAGMMRKSAYSGVIVDRIEREVQRQEEAAR